MLVRGHAGKRLLVAVPDVLYEGTMTILRGSSSSDCSERVAQG